MNIITRTILVTVQRSLHRNPSVLPWYEVTIKVRPQPTVVAESDFARRLASPYEVVREITHELCARWRKGDTIHFLGSEYVDVPSAQQGIENDRPDWE